MKGEPPTAAEPWGHTPDGFDQPIFQLAGERGRLVVAGVRTDDGQRCDLVVVADVGGSFALYPHGAARLGVRLAREDAAIVGRALLSKVGPAPRRTAR